MVQVLHTLFLGCPRAERCTSARYKISSEGMDLAPGEWKGFKKTTLDECKKLAAFYQVKYFAWSGAIYNGFCKVSTKCTGPDLDKHQGYGYKLYKCSGAKFCCCKKSITKGFLRFTIKAQVMINILMF